MRVGGVRELSVKGGVRELECNIGEGERVRSMRVLMECGKYERVGSVSGGVRKGGGREKLGSESGGMRVGECEWGMLEWGM